MNFKSENGSSAVITICIMTFILAIIAFVLDIGVVYIEKSKLVNIADSASLAGGTELPEDPEKARQVAEEYIEKNNLPKESAQIIIGEDNTWIQVKITQKKDFTFARILGISSANVVGNSKAQIGSVTQVYDGTRPFVVEKRDFYYGQQIVLKEGGGDGYCGNYGPISLGGTGASVYEDNIKYGYKGIISIGDILYTETGDMTGPTKKGIQYIQTNSDDTFGQYNKDSIKLWTIPIVDSLQVTGRSPVQVVGFAEFFVEGVDQKGGKAEVTGRFIKFVTNGKISNIQTDYGLYGIKLIQ